jgi:hypothetical protein
MEPDTPAEAKIATLTAEMDGIDFVNSFCTGRKAKHSLSRQKPIASAGCSEYNGSGVNGRSCNLLDL